MTKKAAWLIILLIVIAASLYFIPVQVTKEVNIQLNFDNTYRIMRDVSTWEKWNPTIKRFCQAHTANVSTLNNKKRISFFSKQDSVTVEEISPLLFKVSANINADIFSYALAISPLQSTYATSIYSYEKRRLLYSVFPFITKASEGDSVLASLKKFLENSYNVYGINIQTEKVTKDTVYAVIEGAVVKENAFTSMQQRFNLLNQYVKNKELKQTGFYSISLAPGRDSVYLITGIPVNAYASPLPPYIHCVNIPKGGKMVTAFYKGSFAERNKLYAVVQQYCKDHFLENVGASIESYIDNKVPTADTATVYFKLYYPIR